MTAEVPAQERPEWLAEMTAAELARLEPCSGHPEGDQCGCPPPGLLGGALPAFVEVPLPGGGVQVVAEYGGQGTVYRFHFDTPLNAGAEPKFTAGHYTGHAEPGRLAARLGEHAAGADGGRSRRGSKITAHQVARGGSWIVADTMPGGYAVERREKNHGASMRCSACRGAALEALEAAEDIAAAAARPQPEPELEAEAG